VALDEVDGLYSRGSMLLDGYYKLPEVTAEAFVGKYFSAGGIIARQDKDDYCYLVDRK